MTKKTKRERNTKKKGQEKKRTPRQGREEKETRLLTSDKLRNGEVRSEEKKESEGQM